MSDVLTKDDLYPENPKRRRSVVAVNTADLGGGAERIATQVHRGMRARGWESRLVVGQRRTELNEVVSFHESDLIDYRRVNRRPQQWLNRMKKAGRQALGFQDYVFPLSGRLPDFAEETPDLLHFHNLHGGFFDLRVLPMLSRQFPCIVTLEDAWWFSGHCAYPLSCERWRTGCGRCPQLHFPPEPKRRDATYWNWKEKRAIYSQSSIYAASPSQWLLDEAQKSILSPAIIESCVIPHGVDLNIFQPGDRREARAALDLPEEEFVISFSANAGVSSPFKDFALVRAVARCMGESGVSALFLAIGEEHASESWGEVELRHIPYLKDEVEMAQFYRASNVYFHAAKAEAFGIVIAEAMASGLPVVASAVGGIPEVMGECGSLVPVGEVESSRDALMALFNDSGKRRNHGERARERAENHLGLKRMLDSYNAFYGQVMERFGAEGCRETSDWA